LRAVQPLATVTHIEFRGPLMIVRFPEPRACWSWAIVNGGRVVAPTVAWYFIQSDEYHELAEPAAFLRRKLQEAGESDAVGLLTSRARYGQVETCVQHSGMHAQCIATIGLSNGMRIGDEPTYVPAGTINLVCTVSANLTPACALEAIAMAAEARTAAVMDTTGSEYTGTGTDCIVIAHPTAGSEHRYAGKHTTLGHVIGRAVYQSVFRGVKEWQQKHKT
jgi:adenosylcobinamide amidohydrolase